jgi:drug/metabolite transporter (DMT)-like permease
MHFDFVRNGILIAIIAHSLIGISLVWDKVLLRKPETRNLLSYVFWLGFISIFGLALIPFGFHFPGSKIALLAFGTGVIHLLANYFYYAALKAGEASNTLAIMGGFSPVATALIAIPLLSNPLGHGMLLGFILMVAGGFVMFGSENLEWRRVLPNVLLASGTFGLVNVLEKVVYDRTNFVSGYVFFTFGTFVGALGLLIRGSWRKQIFESSGNAEPRNRFWYFVNRFMAGVGSFLLFYAISRTSPALVDAITGLRYVLIFLGAYGITRLRPAWLRENFAGPVLAGKVVATAMVVAGLVLVGIRSNGESGGASTTHNLALPNRRTPQAIASSSVPFRSLPGLEFVSRSPLQQGDSAGD